MAERFYISDSIGPGEFFLTGAEAHHLATVRRFGPGDRVTLFNGDGNEYPAEIVAIEKKSVVLNILSSAACDRELPFPLVVASALPKGDRSDSLIEKLTELGASRFIPLVTSRSIVIPKEATVEKLSRAVIEASKQCGRNRLMTVEGACKWSELLAREDLPSARYVLHPGSDPDHLMSGTGITIAVGPEGGFTSEEIAAAIALKWKTSSLGSRVLRVETAAIAAAAIVASRAIA